VTVPLPEDVQQCHTRSSFGQVRHLDLVDAEVLLGVVKDAPILPESSISARLVSTTRSRPHAAPDSTPAAGSPRQGPEHVPHHRFHPDAYVAAGPKPPVGGRLVTDVLVTTMRIADVSVIARVLRVLTDAEAAPASVAGPGFSITTKVNPAVRKNFGNRCPVHKPVRGEPVPLCESPSRKKPSAVDMTLRPRASGLRPHESAWITVSLTTGINVEAIHQFPGRSPARSRCSPSSFRPAARPWTPSWKAARTGGRRSISRR